MGRMVELSKRMQAVADMVSAGSRVCDVGCDHGYVSIYLLQSKRAPAALSMDINQGPLLKAREHIRKYEVEDYITLRISDGLAAYQKGEADTLLCAGMGGRLLMNILSREPDKTADFKELVLQPQSEIPIFRKFLREKGYYFLKEDIVLEGGKFYPIMKVAKGEEQGEKEPQIQAMEDLLGPLLLQQRHPVLWQFLKREIGIRQEILNKLEKQEAGERAALRKTQLQQELRLLQRAEEMWDV